MARKLNAEDDMDFKDNTLISTGLYNRDFTETDNSACLVDSDCGCIGQSGNHKCVYLNLCLDKGLYEWVSEQGMNYHETISKLIKQAMNQNAQ